MEQPTPDNAKEKLCRVFKDTHEFYLTNEQLNASILNSVRGQEIFTRNIHDDNAIPYSDENVKIVVSNRSSFDAAAEYTRAGKKVAVLNFASATSPGGGVLFGAFAQEESLCRCSTLYAALSWNNVWEEFYNVHKNGLKEGTLNRLYNDDAIYTPSITVFKNEQYELMNKEDWFNVDIITCAAPNLNPKSSTFNNYNGGTTLHIDDADLYNIYLNRWRQILKIACEKSRCDVLILGAFGCGAFKNPPNIVADAAREALKSYKHNFNTVEFAVLHSPKTVKNYNAFVEAFNKYTVMEENDLR